MSDAVGRSAFLDHHTTVRRVLPASRALVFAMWTDSKAMEAWMTQTDCTLDARVGGSLRVVMKFGGGNYVHTGEYLELRPPERLRFTWTLEGTDVKDTIVTIDLIERGPEETELVLTHEGLPSAKSADEHLQGWEGFLGLLAGALTT